MRGATPSRIVDVCLTTGREAGGTGPGLTVDHGTPWSTGGAITVTSGLRRGSPFRGYAPAPDGVPA